MNLYRLAAQAALACAAFAIVSHAAADNISKRPPIRPLDHACLGPARPQCAVPLYKGSAGGDSIEIATVESRHSQTRTEADIADMLGDLQAKGGAAGADALANVRVLTGVRQGFINNPRTPFKSYQQGETKEYFFRATAVRYQKRPSPAPQVVRVADFVKGEGGDKDSDKSAAGGAEAAMPFAGGALKVPADMAK